MSLAKSFRIGLIKATTQNYSMKPWSTRGLDKLFDWLANLHVADISRCMIYIESALPVTRLTSHIDFVHSLVPLILKTC